ncbi:MAG: SpoIID/LytB domain-containing protein [Nitrospirae bacterium]|nr:SpoIID/LytB domain-containing protein [Nitrospirota bacterium]
MKRDPRKIAAMLVVLIGLLLHGTAEAIETIRVVLFPDLSAVTISAGSGLILTTDDGTPAINHRTTREEITAGPQGLVFQRRSTGLSGLTVSSNGDVIHVNGLTVSGVLHITLYRDKLRVINELDIEEYLKGVVPLEVSPNWHPEALKVQAIVARTYALHQKQTNLGKEYDLLATTADQLYGGKGKEHPAGNQAIAETAGLVLTFGGKLILSAYHSTSAGPTEDASEVWGLELPYLKGVNCPFDRNSPYYQWNKAVPMDTLQETLLTAGYPVGTLASVTPFRWTEAGRISQIRFLHSQGELILKAEDLRRILGYAELPSTQFRIEKIGREIRIQGRGYGHAVGLCQWGAKEMAEMGYSYDKILKYYYPGVRIQPHASITTDEPSP